MSIDFPKKYKHVEAEKKWQDFWQEKGVYHWQDDKPRAETFVIDTPPPTVSGVLHMGHIFSYTQADFIARYKRMKGFDVFYPMGFDDNGLPTERLVEKVTKKRASDYTREEFIKVCEEVVEDAEKEFENLFNSIALSVDWRQKYETISERSRKISQLSFLDLYNKGHVERRYQPMYWDPVDQTAIASAEMEEKELDSFENFLWFGLTNEGGDDLGKAEIMTTRPEMLAACVALLYHPSKEIPDGATHATTPLFGAKVPLIADETVDPEKGTGFVMCCTFGDEQDIDWWRTHDLTPSSKPKIILNKYGKITDEIDIIEEVEPGKGRSIIVKFIKEEDKWIPKRVMEDKVYPRDNKTTLCSDVDSFFSQYSKIVGKKVPEARRLVIELLEQGGFTANEKKPIKHMVKCAERSGAALEIIPTEQWFVKITDKKEQITEKINECQWYPNFMKLRAEQWTENLSWDWCISRQRYFGVPFPVWYKEDGSVVVASEDELPINPLVDKPKGYEDVELTPDLDVMDTWATSSVSPQLNSHAFLDDDRHSKLFPADLRPQAHEIIRTWAFYTIVKAMLHENKIPWQNLMISGWCLAEDKSKMSKSKGNVVTPVPLIEAKSSDVVRYWASTSNLGSDTAYSEDVLKIGNKLVNKLWNVCKFASINLARLEGEVSPDNCTEILDKWILTRLNKTIKEAEKQFEVFEYCKARMAIEDFFWNDFCDNYLEMVKTRAYGEETGGVGQQSALNAIYICVEKLLKLWAPFVPHVTEELNSIIFGGEGSIHARGSWPEANLPESEDAELCGKQAIEALELVRKFKSEQGVSIKFPIKKLEVSGASVLVQAADDLKYVTSSEEIIISEEEEVSAQIELGEQEAA